jgi:hypothetical protein
MVFPSGCHFWVCFDQNFKSIKLWFVVVFTKSFFFLDVLCVCFMCQLCAIMYTLWNLVISSLLQAFKVIKMSKVLYLLGLLKIVKCYNSCTLCYLLTSSLIPKSFVNYLVYCLKLAESFQSASFVICWFQPFLNRLHLVIVIDFSNNLVDLHGFNVHDLSPPQMIASFIILIIMLKVKMKSM